MDGAERILKVALRSLDMGMHSIFDHPRLVQRMLLLLLGENKDTSSASEEVKHIAGHQQIARLIITCRQWHRVFTALKLVWEAPQSITGQQKVQHSPAVEAVTLAQRSSLSHAVDRITKEALFSEVTLENRSNYFRVSCRPITKKAEDDMEILSDLSTWGEHFLHFWQPGSYACARCEKHLYHSSDKWSGPCPWPSWRKPLAPNAISETVLGEYNNYTCAVAEVRV